MREKSPRGSSRDASGERWLQYGRGAALVFEFTGTVAAGFIVGHLADAKLGTDPWVTIACTVLSVVGGFIRLVQVVRRLDMARSDRRQH